MSTKNHKTNPLKTPGHTVSNPCDEFPPTNGKCYPVSYTSQTDWICDKGFVTENDLPCTVSIEDNRDMEQLAEQYEQEVTFGVVTLADLWFKGMASVSAGLEILQIFVNVIIYYSFFSTIRISSHNSKIVMQYCDVIWYLI